MGVKLTSVIHLKALIILYWNLDRPEAWQNFYYGPRPLKKAILHLKMATVRFIVNTAVLLSILSLEFVGIITSDGQN